MKLIIISGLSGSGKSVALHTLEDEEYYCVDNLPPTLLAPFVHELQNEGHIAYSKTAVGIDARTSETSLDHFPEHLQKLREQGVDVEVVFFDADTQVLLKRFSETRRRHPLSHEGLPLFEAIREERALLSTVKENADLVIDTSSKNVHELRKLIIEKVRSPSAPSALSVLFQSFGFKHGIPGDTDFIFDIRCLPNPYWVPELRPLSGKDPEVKAFMEQQPIAEEMLQSIRVFLEKWLPEYEAEKRRYITISIGCNGGQHRSVYFCERLAEIFQNTIDNISVRHRELP